MTEITWICTAQITKIDYCDGDPVFPAEEETKANIAEELKRQLGVDDVVVTKVQTHLMTVSDEEAKARQFQAAMMDIAHKTIK